MKQIFLILKSEDKTIQLGFNSTELKETEIAPLFLSTNNKVFHRVSVKKEDKITTYFYSEIKIMSIQSFIDCNNLIRSYPSEK
jgi:hypothetical protein